MCKMEETSVQVVETSDVSTEEIDEMLRELGVVIPEPDPVEEARESLEQAISEVEAVREEAVNEAAVPYTVTASREESEKTIIKAVEEMPIIPPNSPSLLVSEFTSRFSSAVWYDAVRTKSILLAGVGGIGSYVAFLLSRMNPESMTLYDPDIVETANMSGQLYGKKDVGCNKVDRMGEMMAEYSNYYKTVSIPKRFDISCASQDIMICGFDNMKARKVFFRNWLQHVLCMPTKERKKCLFIDGRLAAEELQVFCITGDDEYHQTVYEKQHLFSDSEADATVCSYKQTSHCANMIGSLIVNLFVNFVANECEPLIPRDLPFLTSYDAERMFFKTEII